MGDVTKLSGTKITQCSGLKKSLRYQLKMTLQLPYTFRPHKCPYKRRMPGLTRENKDVKQETVHVLSNPGDFLLLDKFTSTGFINKIYNLEVYRFPFLEMESVTYWNEECRDVELGSLEQTIENQPKFFANSMKHVESLPSPRFIKTHLPISMLPPDLPNKAKVIYVGRNVKDICVSGFYHSRPDIDFSKP